MTLTRRFLPVLTNTEELVLARCWWIGSTNGKALARDLHVSLKTVETHCYNIERKLHVHGRDEAVLLWLKSALARITVEGLFNALHLTPIHD